MLRALALIIAITCPFVAAASPFPVTEALWKNFDFQVRVDDGISNEKDASSGRVQSPTGSLTVTTNDFTRVGTQGGILNPEAIIDGAIGWDGTGFDIFMTPTGNFSGLSSTLQVDTISVAYVGSPIAIVPLTGSGELTTPADATLRVSGTWIFGTNVIPFDVTGQLEDLVFSNVVRASTSRIRFENSAVIQVAQMSIGPLTYSALFDVGFAVYVVPEPTTALLLGLGLVGLAGARRRDAA